MSSPSHANFVRAAQTPAAAPVPPLPAFIEREIPCERGAARVRVAPELVPLLGRETVCMHYLIDRPSSDDGAAQDAPDILLMHGNPMWSYLYRHVIRELQTRRASGAPIGRIIAPDLLGLGLSDKPRALSAHRIDLHVQLVAGLLSQLNVQRVILVGQDWGGPVVGGLLAGATLEPWPDLRVEGLLLANTGVLAPKPPFRTTAFHRFAHSRLLAPLAFQGLGFPLPVLDRVQGDKRSIRWVDKAAYAWPLRRPKDRAAPLALARMVPNNESHPSMRFLQTIEKGVRAFDGPTTLVWGTRDPILGRALHRHREALPEATVHETCAGHFLQEEVPEPMAVAIAQLSIEGIKKTS